jgi:hypothetical protein
VAERVALREVTIPGVDGAELVTANLATECIDVARIAADSGMHSTAVPELHAASAAEG